MMDGVSIYKLFAETDTLIAVLEKRVKKGKGLDEALEVCRYLFWSGLLKLLKENAGQAVMRIDPNKLEKRVNKLQELIREEYDAKPDREETRRKRRLRPDRN